MSLMKANIINLGCIVCQHSKLIDTTENQIKWPLELINSNVPKFQGRKFLGPKATALNSLLG